VLSGKSATKVTAEQILQLDYFSKPLSDLEHKPPTPSPPVVMETPQEVVIKSTDEPMEIGVFRAEDYMYVWWIDLAIDYNSDYFKINVV